jgi:hypothetical protein
MTHANAVRLVSCVVFVSASPHVPQWHTPWRMPMPCASYLAFLLLLKNVVPFDLI